MKATTNHSLRNIVVVLSCFGLLNLRAVILLNPLFCRLDSWARQVGELD